MPVNGDDVLGEVRRVQQSQAPTDGVMLPRLISAGRTFLAPFPVAPQSVL
jgi:hypothetical protein